MHGRQFIGNVVTVIPAINPPTDGSLEFWVVAQHATVPGRVLKLAVFRGGKYPETRARKLAAILNSHLAQLSMLLPDFILSFNIDVEKLDTPLRDVQPGKGRPAPDRQTPLIEDTRV